MTGDTKSLKSFGRKAVARAEAEVSLQPILTSLDLAIGSLHSAHPDRKATLAAWVQGLVDHGFIRSGLDTQGVVREVCEWFEGVQHLVDAERSAFESVDRMDAGGRLRVGQERGQIMAAIKIASDMPEVRLALEARLASLSLPERDKRAPRTVEVKTQLGDQLMSIMIAAGYGAGLGSRFTIPAAARLVAKIAACYGFELRERSLATRASQLKKG